ncbi:uncharacterized protein LOC144167254 isoform X1 [Haemaphysalis longicornis]
MRAAARRNYLHSVSMRELVAGTDTGGFAPSIFVVSVILLPWIYLSDEGILPRSQGWLATQKHSTLTSPHYVLHRAYGPTGAVHAAKPTTQHGTGYVGAIILATTEKGRHEEGGQNKQPTCNWFTDKGFYIFTSRKNGSNYITQREPHQIPGGLISNL